jgi:hypothetical protein
MDKNTYEQLEPVEFNFEQSWVPDKARKLKPAVYKNGDQYCCIFGPDPEVGIYGCGNSPEEAIIDWERDLEKRIERLTEGDDATHHAIKHLGQH